jgi:hypothetical protein
MIYDNKCIFKLPKKKWRVFKGEYNFLDFAVGKGKLLGIDLNFAGSQSKKG